MPPPDADAGRALFDRAVAQRRAGAYDDAAALLDELLAAGATPPRLIERSLVELARGTPAAALPFCRQARNLAPQDTGVRINLAVALRLAGAPEAALAELDGAPEAARNIAEWHNQRGQALLATERATAAEAALAEAAQQAPERGDLWHSLAQARNRQDRFGAAETAFDSALDAAQAAGWPAAQQARLWHNLGMNRREQGRIAAALAAFDRALALAPELVEAASYRLLCQHYDPQETAESLYRAHVAWHQRYAAGLEAAAAPPAPASSAARPLRVGILAGNLYRQPGLWLYLPALENLDPQRIELVVYDFSPKHDDFSRRLGRVCRAWRALRGLDDAAAAAQIRQDGIDVLVNKNGHAEGRLLICARRPAPVQVQWGGYNTTGLASVDAFLGDPVETPPGSEALFTERLWRLPNDYVCYEPPRDVAPPVGPLPARDAGVVTFGCFNHPAKINARIAALWADILQRVPASYLFLKGKAFGEAGAAQALRATLAEAGIPATRLILEGRSPHGELLGAYNRVDIALDPWPYSGGLTTLEALWMGVPVLTLPGPSFAGRHAATHLSAVGLADWIADAASDYVEMAVAASHNLEGLSVLRAGLRQRVAESPVCTGPGFAGHLQEALETLYAEHARTGGEHG